MFAKSRRGFSFCDFFSGEMVFEAFEDTEGGLWVDKGMKREGSNLMGGFLTLDDFLRLWSSCGFGRIELEEGDLRD